MIILPSHHSPAQPSPRSCRAAILRILCGSIPSRLRAVSFCLLLTILTGAGCADRLPHYNWTSHQTAIADLAARGRRVHTLSGNATVTLTNPKGDRISFDSAIVAQFPGQFRIRAWKFGHAIFDLTVTPDGVWLVKSQRVPKDRIWPATLTPDRFAWGWRMITGQTLADATPLPRTSEQFARFQQPLEGALTLTTELDTATLTIRSYQVRDQNDKLRFTLKQDHYHAFDDIIWPQRVVATSDQGTIAVNFEDLELNAPLPPAAFTPPTRAEKIQ